MKNQTSIISLQTALENAIRDAETVIAIPDAVDSRELGLTDIQVATMAQVIIQHLQGAPDGERGGGTVFLTKPFRFQD